MFFIKTTASAQIRTKFSENIPWIHGSITSATLSNFTSTSVFGLAYLFFFYYYYSLREREREIGLIKETRTTAVNVQALSGC